MKNISCLRPQKASHMKLGYQSSIIILSCLQNVKGLTKFVTSSEMNLQIKD